MINHLKLYQNQFLELNHYTQIQETKFVSLQNYPKHQTFLDIAKKDDVVGYRTDYEKALKNDFYKKNIMIEEYKSEKQSTLLEISKDDIRAVSSVSYTKAGNLYHGALKSSYERSLLNSEIDRNINEFGRLRKMLICDLEGTPLEGEADTMISSILSE
jgi:hypothetical protein